MLSSLQVSYDFFMVKPIWCLMGWLSTSLIRVLINNNKISGVCSFFFFLTPRVFFPTKHQVLHQTFCDNARIIASYECLHDILCLTCNCKVFLLWHQCSRDKSNRIPLSSLYGMEFLAKHQDATIRYHIIHGKHLANTYRAEAIFFVYLRSIGFIWCM